MDKVESRRVAPMGWITAGLVGLLLGFELLVMCGAIELRAGTVAHFAPWAYEPFLKFVGEHPESAAPRKQTPEPAVKENPLTNITGFSADAIEVELDVEVAEPSESVVEPEPEPEPVENPQDSLPVG